MSRIQTLDILPEPNQCMLVDLYYQVMLMVTFCCNTELSSTRTIVVLHQWYTCDKTLGIRESF